MRSPRIAGDCVQLWPKIRCHFKQLNMVIAYQWMEHPLLLNFREGEMVMVLKTVLKSNENGWSQIYFHVCVKGISYCYIHF